MKVLCVLALLCAVALGAQWTRLDPHIVANGTHIHKNGTHISFFGPDGAVSHFLEQYLPSSRSVVVPAASTSASGWVSSFWAWGSSFTYITGVWTVPAKPTNQQNQIIFFFNSLEGATSGGGSGSDILQPVLQWNNGVPGWTLASWYGTNGKYTEATPVAVNVGDTITGTITLSGGNWYVYSYVNGALKSTLSISQASFQSGDAQNTAQWALEVYNMATCDQYSPANSLALRNIVLKDNGNTVTPSWSTPSANANACNAGGSVQSSSQVTIIWNSGSSSSSSSSSGQSTSGCGSGLLYCAHAGGSGQCYSSSSYVCNSAAPYLCPTSNPHACNGGCQAAAC